MVVSHLINQMPGQGFQLKASTYFILVRTQFQPSKTLSRVASDISQCSSLSYFKHLLQFFQVNFLLFNLHIILCSSLPKTSASMSTWCFVNTSSPSVPKENRIIPLSPAPLINCSRTLGSGLGGFTVNGPTSLVSVIRGTIGQTINANALCITD